jgi:hypothetical protein
LPVYIWFIFNLLIGISLIAVLVIIAARREMSGPFSALRDLFGDDARQAALARGFTCGDDGFQNRSQTISGYCVQQNMDQMFSGIYMRMSGNAADEITFTVRGSMVRLGDLEVVWGSPEIRRYCETMVASWPADDGIVILVVSPTDGFSHFAPILHIYFTRGDLPRWTRYVMREARRGCE